MVPDARAEVPGSLRGDDSRYTGYRRVGVRLMEEFDRTLVDSRKAIDSENDFTRGLQWFDKAHTVMLVEEGIIPRDGARACLAALRASSRETWTTPASRSAAAFMRERPISSSSSVWRSAGSSTRGRSSWGPRPRQP